MSRDVAVLGGGPSGALTAALLCRQNPGLRVLVLERARFPRHHVGEVTLPGWHTVLERAGALEALSAALPIRKLGVVFRWGPEEAGESWTADFREPATGGTAPGSWHVERSLLDQVLLDNAASQGAEVWQEARVTAVARTEAGFRVSVSREGQDRTVDARRVIDCTGQARLLARLWGLPLRRFDDMSNVAVYGYFRGSRLTDLQPTEHADERWALVCTSEHGWVWHIPVGEDLVSVGLVTHQDALAEVPAAELADFWRREVARTPGIGELLAHAKHLGDRPDGGRGPGTVSVDRDWAYRVEEVAGPGWLLAGDAAVFVDPVLSSGLTLAAHGASMAANHVTTLARDPDTDEALLAESYQRTLSALSRAYHRMAQGWYDRNLRADSWHWKARRERLRTSGAAVLTESDAEAFTAVCLGAIASPLDAATGRASQDSWGSEFFSWLVTEHLFARPAGGGGETADEARAAGARSVALRWRDLALSALAPPRTPWQARRGFHTHKGLDTWRPVHFVDFPELETVCAAFPDLPEAAFGALNGREPTWAVLRQGLAAHPVGSADRDTRVRGLVDGLLQLHMLGGLRGVRAAPAPRLSGTALLGRLAPAVVRSVDRPTRLVLAPDPLGETVWVRLIDAGRGRWLRVAPGPAVDWPRGLDDDLDGLVARVSTRLAAVDLGPLWAELPQLIGAAIGLACTPGEAPQAFRVDGLART